MYKKITKKKNNQNQKGKIIISNNKLSFKKISKKKNVLIGSGNNSHPQLPVNFDKINDQLYGTDANVIITYSQPKGMSYETFIQLCQKLCKEKKCHIFTIDKYQKGYLKFFKETSVPLSKLSYFNYFLQFLFKKNIDPLPYLMIELDLNSQKEEIENYQNSCSENSVYLKKINQLGSPDDSIPIDLEGKLLKLHFFDENSFKKYFKESFGKDVKLNQVIKIITNSSKPDKDLYYISEKVKCIPPAIFFKTEECKCNLKRVAAEKIINQNQNFNSYIDQKSLIYLTNLLSSLNFINKDDQVLNKLSEKRSYYITSKNEKSDQDLLLEVFKELVIDRYNYLDSVNSQTISNYLNSFEEQKLNKPISINKLDNQYYKIIITYLIFILTYLPNYQKLNLEIQYQINFIIGQILFFDKNKEKFNIFNIFRYFITIYNSYLFTFDNPQIFKINSKKNLTFENFFIYFSKVKSKYNSDEYYKLNNNLLFINLKGENIIKFNQFENVNSGKYIKIINQIIFCSLNFEIKKDFQKNYLLENNNLKLGHFLFLDIYKINEINQLLYNQYKEYFNQNNSLVNEKNIQNILNLILFVFNILSKFFPNLISIFYLQNIDNDIISNNYSDMIKKINDSNEIFVVGTVWMQISKEDLRYLNPISIKQEHLRLYNDFKESYQDIFFDQISKLEQNNYKIYLPPNIQLVQQYILFLENENNFDLTENLNENLDINSENIKQILILEGYNSIQISLIIDNLKNFITKKPIIELKNSNNFDNIKKLNLMLNSIVIISANLWILIVKLLELSNNDLKVKIIPNVCNLVINYISNYSISSDDISSDDIITLSNYIVYQLLINNTELGYQADLNQGPLNLNTIFQINYLSDPQNLDTILSYLKEVKKYQINDSKFNDKIREEKNFSDTFISMSLYDKFKEELTDYLANLDIKMDNDLQIIKWLFNSNSKMNTTTNNGFYKLFENYQNEYITLNKNSDEYYFIALSKTISYYSQSNIIPNIDGLNGLINIDYLLNILLSSSKLIKPFLDSYESKFLNIIEINEKLKFKNIDVANLEFGDNICVGTKESFRKRNSQYDTIISNPITTNTQIFLDLFDSICQIFSKFCQNLLMPLPALMPLPGSSSQIIDEINNYKVHIESQLKNFIESFFIYLFVNQKNIQSNNLFFLFISKLLVDNPGYSNFLNLIIYIREMPRELKIFFYNIIYKIFKLINNFLFYQTSDEDDIKRNLETIIELLSKKKIIKDILQTFINLVNVINQKESNYKNTKPFVTTFKKLDLFLNINIGDLSKIIWIMNYLFDNNNSNLFSSLLNTINTNHLFINLRIKIDFYLFIDFKCIKEININNTKKIGILIIKDKQTIDDYKDLQQISNLMVNLSDTNAIHIKKKICQYNSFISFDDQIIYFNYNTNEEYNLIYKYFKIEIDSYLNLYNYDQILNLDLKNEDKDSNQIKSFILQKQTEFKSNFELSILFYNKKIPDHYLNSELIQLKDSSINDDKLKDYYNIQGEKIFPNNPYRYLCLKTYYELKMKNYLFLVPNMIYIFSFSDIQNYLNKQEINIKYFLPNNQLVKLINSRFSLESIQKSFFPPKLEHEIESSAVKKDTKENQKDEIQDEKTDWENSYNIFNQDILKMIVFLTLKKICKTLYFQIFSTQDQGYFEIYQNYLNSINQYFNKESENEINQVESQVDVSRNNKKCFCYNFYNLIKMINNFTYYYNLFRLSNSFNYDQIYSESLKISTTQIGQYMYLNNLLTEYNIFKNNLNKFLVNLNFYHCQNYDDIDPEMRMKLLRNESLDKFWEEELVKINEKKKIILSQISETYQKQIEKVIIELENICKSDKINVVYIKYINGNDIISIPQLISNQDFSKSQIEKISKIDINGNLLEDIYKL